MSYLQWFIYFLGQKQAIMLLFAVNFIGTIYGYLWYENQLLSTEWYLWPFVPDSPTASLFFSITLLAFLLKKRWPYVEAFAAVTLFKYGIWAPVMLISTGLLGGELNWMHYVLIASHLGMALQSLLYIPYFSFGVKHLVVIAAWTLTNDVLDYNLGIFPWLDAIMHPYLNQIYLFTVLLSIVSLLIFYFYVVRRKTKRQKLYHEV